MEVDVFVLGAGSGGIGCIYRLLKYGLRVAVCDSFSDFGGASVFSGVSCWEPGVSLNGLHRILASHLERYGAHAAKSVPNCNIFYPENRDNWSNSDFSRYPWGLSFIDAGSTYNDTLRRYGLDYTRQTRRFQFDEVYFPKAVREILSPYSENLISFFGHHLSSVETNGNKISSVTLSNGEMIKAKYFVDAGGSIPLARMSGCKVAIGSEAKEVYNEPSAYAKSDDINGVSYVFRIRKTTNIEHIDEIPPEYVNESCSSQNNIISCFNVYPNGDINVNMLPTMSGKEFILLGRNADREGRRRVWNYWHYLQTEKGMKGYTLIKMFNAGIREDYRLVGKKVLTENDIRKGISISDINSSIIAVGDHALDIHGGSDLLKEFSAPYGIPIECCMTNEFENLFVSCRGASFSHIAASSARLSRTMLSLGEGVGEYISMLILDRSDSFSALYQTQNLKEFIKSL